MNKLHTLVLAALIGASSLTLAQTDDKSVGEIRKVDKDAGQLTIKHGELKNLGMQGMTMVFKVKDPAMLEKVKAGDKVRFVADKVGSALMVTAIEPAQRSGEVDK